MLSVALVGNTANASVSINEIAWMGGLNSANHEWIEIFNDSDSAINVDGWTIKDSQSLLINLAGSIGSNAYVVLERTSEESAPGTAFLIYTGALVNSGTTLVLANSAGEIIDQVTGGIDWENIGGDNTTKETAQYTTSGWVTDVGTPGAINGPGRVEEVVLPEEDLGENDIPVVTNNTVRITKTSRNDSSSTIVLKNTDSKMVLEVDAQSVGYVNQKLNFRVLTKGLGSNDSKLVSYEWNFGDSNIASSSKVEHTYKYPGNYVITIHAKSGKKEQITRHEITILPVKFSLSLNEEGNIQINNDSSYDVDMSGYILKGDNRLVFPPRSIIKAFGTITIDLDRVSDGKEYDYRLYDAQQKLLTSTSDIDTFQNEEDLYLNSDLDIPSSKKEILSASLDQVIVPEVEIDDNLIEPKSEIDLSKNTEDLPNDKNDHNRWPYLALVALLLFVMVSIPWLKK